MTTADTSYSAGLRFVNSTPSRSLDERQRKTIRSHATKAGSRIVSQDAPRLSSGTKSQRKRDSPQMHAHGKRHASLYLSTARIPRRLGSDFSGLKLPPGFDHSTVAELVQLIQFSRVFGYPHEICLNVHPVERGWFPYMISDVCCLHSLLYSLRAFLCVDSAGSSNYLACYHYAQTLQILQQRLNEADLTSSICDATIMVVVTLAMIARHTGDLPAMGNHVKGLAKIVNLRGGVRALNGKNLHVKVYRADLAYALLSNQRPLLFDQTISWDRFIIEPNAMKCNGQPYEVEVYAFAATHLDTRLYNTFRDVHSFSCVSNLAFQTTRKLSPDLYNQMMISIHYRLIQLSYVNDQLQETIRIALLAFSATIFIQQNLVEQRFIRLVELYSDSLWMLLKSKRIDLPPSVLLWLAMLSHIVVPEPVDPSDWRSFWLEKAISDVNVVSWAQALDILRAFAWVDFIHSEAGEKIFVSAIAHLRREKDLSICSVMREDENPVYVLNGDIALIA